MAGVYLMASRPGAFTKEGLILGNPEARANAVTPTGSYVAALTLDAAAKYRLLSVVTDAEIELLQTSEGETSSSFNGVATRVPPPSSGNTAYACLLHPATTKVWIKTP